MRLPKHPSVRATSTARMLIAAAQVATASLFAAWAVASCGGSSATFSCADSYGVQCGKACTDNAGCDRGLSCANGSCTAECTPAGGCGDGKVCSLTGSCVDPTPGITGTPCGPEPKPCPAGFYCGQESSCKPGCNATTNPCPDGTMCGANSSCGPIASLAGTGGTGTTGTGNFEGDGCVNLTVGFEGRTPTVMLLVDQSGSMTEKFPAGAQTDRWTVLYNALMDPTAGAVTLMAPTVRMGLALYSSNGGNKGGMCPNLTQVPIAINNFAAIDAVYKPALPAHDTPTGGSIDAVVKVLAAEPDPKYILLVTDGLPDTCENSNPGGGAEQTAANDFTVKSAQAAKAAGIGLFIMGVSADIAPDHLQAMANAGAGLDPATMGAMAAKYYVASDNQAALAMQLTGILGSVRNCVFHLGGTVQMGREGDGVVSLDGTRLTLNDPNGFKLNNGSELEVLGTACEKIKSDSKGLTLSFPCDAIDIAK
jgi:hypothetical protein